MSPSIQGKHPVIVESHLYPTVSFCSTQGRGLETGLQEFGESSSHEVQVSSPGEHGPKLVPHVYPIFNSEVHVLAPFPEQRYTPVNGRQQLPVSELFGTVHVSSYPALLAHVGEPPGTN